MTFYVDFCYIHKMFEEHIRALYDWFISEYGESTNIVDEPTRTNKRKDKNKNTMAAAGAQKMPHN